MACSKQNKPYNQPRKQPPSRSNNPHTQNTTKPPTTPQSQKKTRSTANTIPSPQVMGPSPNTRKSSTTPIDVDLDSTKTPPTTASIGTNLIINDQPMNDHDGTATPPPSTPTTRLVPNHTKCHLSMTGTSRRQLFPLLFAYPQKSVVTMDQSQFLLRAKR